MKKIILFGAGLCVFTLVTMVNLKMVSECKIGSRSLEIIAKMAKADPEEIEIICNANPPGQCWLEDCHWVPTPLGGWFMTYCPTFTGRMDDHCENNMPC